MYKPDDKVGQLKLAIALELLPGLPPIQNLNYRLIVADPPWQYELRETDPTHRGRCPYPNMSDDAILNLPIGAIRLTAAALRYRRRQLLFTPVGDKQSFTARISVFATLGI
jgi:hypothetical protein